MEMKKSYIDPMTGRGPFRRNQAAPAHNIILISLDMVPREFYLETGYPVALRADNIKHLADDHLSFSNAFCSSPLCSPSRASYLSGRYTYITGNSERTHDGHITHVRDTDTLFPEYLKASGYHMRHAGKCHIGTHKYMDIFGENDCPWDRWSPPWFDDDRYNAFLKSKGFSSLSFGRSIYGQELRGKGQGNLYGGWIEAQQDRVFPSEATYPAFLVQQAIEALENRQDGNQPFYLQLDFFGPHQPFAIPGDLADREREIRESLQLPNSYRRLLQNGFQAPWIEPRVYRMYRKNWSLYDPQAMIDYMVANQLQFEIIDGMIGRLLQYLKQQGEYERTWIFLIADHGEMNGESALIDKGAFLNPAVIRVPLIIKPPADHPLAGTAKSLDTMVSLLDLAPTILSIAGVSTEERLDGCSLLDTAQGVARSQEKPILFDIWSHVIPNPAIGTVWQASDGMDYMYTFNSVDDIDELYRLGGPQELDNLIQEQGSAGIAAEAIKRMDRLLEADARWKGYSDYFKLDHAERLDRPSGDRQHFIGMKE